MKVLVGLLFAATNALRHHESASNTKLSAKLFEKCDTDGNNLLEGREFNCVWEEA